MADGTFAALMFGLGLLDMSLNYCGDAGGCLARSESRPMLAVSAGEIVRRRAMPAGEVYVRYEFGRRFGPFGNLAGVSLGERGELWVGFGQSYDIDLGGGPFFVRLHAMPGLYFPNGGFDLGGLVEFRSGVEVGYESAAGWRFGFGYDHRSNAGLFASNPGVETVHLRVSFPLE